MNSLNVAEINLLDLDNFIENADGELIKIFDSLCDAFPDLEPSLILEFLITHPSNEVIEHLLVLSSSIENENKKNKNKKLNNKYDDHEKYPIIYPQQLFAFGDDEYTESNKSNEKRESNENDNNKDGFLKNLGNKINSFFGNKNKNISKGIGNNVFGIEEIEMDEYNKIMNKQL